MSRRIIRNRLFLLVAAFVAAASFQQAPRTSFRALGSKQWGQKNDESIQSSDNDESPLGSLDSVLERARQRQTVTLPYRLQAMWDAPLVSIDYEFSKFVVTRGDMVLIVVALAIHANGFALGLLLGKATAAPLRQLLKPPLAVQMVLQPVWPVVWAIALDQVM